MGKARRSASLVGACLALSWLLAAPPVATGVELKKGAVEAFEHYVRLTEARSDGDLRGANPFLWVDGLPEARRQALYTQLRRGRIVIERLEEHADGKPIRVPNGLIHHWVGVVFIPGATLQQTMALVTDYDNHQNVYRPDVMRSKLLHHNGNHYSIYLRFYKKKIITAVLNTEHEVDFFPLDAERAYSRSYTTRIAEVENPGQPNEREKPVGDDRGFLWRLNSYWRFQEKAGGVYVQCESVSLSRDIPRGLGWLIVPFITSVPKESLVRTLEATRAALLRGPTAGLPVQGILCLTAAEGARPSSGRPRSVQPLAEEL